MSLYLQKFPEIAKKIIEDLLDDNYILTLVGGGARSLITNEKLGDDLDFEIRFQVQYIGSEYLDKIDKTFTLLNKKNKNLKIEKLLFGGRRCLSDKLCLEFTPPRKEYYSVTSQNGYSHQGFEVEIDSSLDYYKSFLRRDFTINAIGIEIKKQNKKIEEKIIDPFHGIEDLNSLTLRYIHTNFFLDPVRFLRLIRFHIQKNYKIDPILIEKLSSFSLQKISFFHYHKESSKIGFFHFSKCFYYYVNKYQIPCTTELQLLNINYDDLDCGIAINTNNLTEALIILSISGKVKNVDGLIKLLSLKEIWVGTLKVLSSLLKLLPSIEMEIEVKNYSMVKELPLFKALQLLDKVKIKIELYQELIISLLSESNQFKYITLNKILYIKNIKKLDLSKLKDEDKNDFIIYSKLIEFKRAK